MSAPRRSGERADAPAGRGERDSGPAPRRLPPPGSAIHLVGIGGAGMRGLGLLLVGAGYRVSGCDRQAADPLRELRALGVTLEAGHDPAHVSGTALVVRSSAVPEDAPEIRAAREAGIPVLRRAEAMGALLEGRRVAGIAGTHGKTTITAMTGLACEAAGLDPTVLVGGRVPAWGGFARAGAGPLAVVEADEYDRSFLELDPALALVSSVEPEHLESYGSEEALRDAFVEFAGRAAGREGLLVCADDPGARRVAERVGSGRTYGFAEGADYRVEIGDGDAGGQRARLALPGGESLAFRVAAPGRHNAQNAAGALAAALRVGADPARLGDALAGFAGVERRLELLCDRGGVAVVDDYAHHPTEVRASLAALRVRFPGRRLVAVFQPHLYSRTRAFHREFREALAAADEALVLPIYPAREEALPGVTSALIAGEPDTVAKAREAGGPGPAVRLADREAALAAVERGAGAGREVAFAFMGAGDVTELAREAADRIGRKDAGRAGDAVGT